MRPLEHCRANAFKAGSAAHRECPAAFFAPFACFVVLLKPKGLHETLNELVSAVDHFLQQIKFANCFTRLRESAPFRVGARRGMDSNFHRCALAAAAGPVIGRGVRNDG